MALSPASVMWDVEQPMHDLTPPTVEAPDRSPDHRQAFDETFLRLLPSVRVVCRRILGSESAAEDAAAEAFIRALVRWSKLQSHPNRDAWIYRVATNVALDQLRKQRREGQLGVGPATADLGTDAILGVDLRRALAALPRRQREVVVLRHVVGLSEQETADAMGVSINTVKTHGNRAVTALRTSTDLRLEGGLT